MNYDMNIHHNPDAQAWAKFFISTIEDQSFRLEDIDEELMIGWFANAMMAMHDHIKSQRTWVGLTDEEINTVAYNNHPLDGIRTFALAIEAALRSKNT